jgi:TolB protein
VRGLLLIELRTRRRAGRAALAAAVAALLASSLATTVPAAGDWKREHAGVAGRIAFIRSSPFGSTLFVMNAEGSHQSQLTSGEGWITTHAWSPDGRRLVFARWTKPEGTDVYVVTADGTGLRRLTDGPLNQSDPAWSPDGRTIAYTRRGFVRGKNRGGLYLMKPDGSGKRRLDRLRAYNPAPSPAWSPDGRRIAFSGGGAVFVINADGSGQRRLTGGSGYFFLAWSPDGSRIAFVKMPGRYDSIYVVGLDGKPERRVTRHAYTESGFAWRPDGRGIIYARERRGGVYSINLDGSGDHRLTRNSLRQDLSAGGFSWSPDGHTIAYASDVTGHGDIYLMNPEGSRQRQLTDTPEIDGAPIWAPMRSR